MSLVNKGKFPSWAMFCLPELKESAASNYIPAELALICEDAILLHPVKAGNGFIGLLIARESASKQTRKFIKDDGSEVILTVPDVGTKIIAEENVTLFP
jgi:hypothetical protein